MRESYFETRHHWPSVEVPTDLLAYFVTEQLSENPFARICIHDRQRFLHLLDWVPDFRLFWEQAREIYPEKLEYLDSLTDEQKPFEPNWIKQEYYRYLYKGEFNKLSGDERDQLQTRFDKVRPKAYEAASKAEAIRLNCAVPEVKPPCLVLPSTSDGNEQSEIVDLPDSLLLQIMNRLDTLDIFRITLVLADMLTSTCYFKKIPITLVCKKWRSLICNNPRDLKRAEHAKTTHLITFTEWMDPTRIISRRMFKQSYRRFSWGLIKWCFRIAEHLETVILDHPIPDVDAAAFIQSCPNLKNLQIGCDEPFECTDGDGPFSSDVMLPKLEFYCSWTFNSFNLLELDTKVLLSCGSLRYFGASLIPEQIPPIDVRDQMKLAFGNLIALDLQGYSFVALEILAEIDDLQLRYLGLGSASPYDDSTNAVDVTTTLRGLLERILPKLQMLEILKVDGTPGIGSSTIKLLTELKLNLEVAAFFESFTFRRGFSNNNPNEEDYFTAEVLTDFGQMLMSNDPGLDLSEFYFKLFECEIPQDLEEIDFDFTFISFKELRTETGCYFGLNFQSIKRRLGIAF